MATMSCAIAAPAQQPDAMPTVVVTAAPGTYDPRRDDTAAKIVIDSIALARYGDASIADALKRVPGVTVASTGRGADIRLRGLGSGYTQILVNGERAPPGFSVDALSPVQVERVEIIRSASAEYSTEAIAGTINIVLKKTVRTAQRQIQLGYGGDAAERTPRLAMLLADRTGALSYSVSANGRVSWFHRTGRIDDSLPTADTGTTSDEVGRFSTLNLIPRLNWLLPEGDSLSLDSTLALTRFHFSALQRSESVSGPPPTFARFDWRIGTRNVAGKSELAWATRPWQGATLVLKAGVQVANGTNDARRVLYGDAPAVSSFTAVGTREHGASTSGKLASRMADAHQLTAGWETSRTARTESNDEIDGPLASPTPARALTAFDGSVRRAAAFVQDEWTVAPAWSLYVGARVEQIGTDIVAGGSRWSGMAQVWSPVLQTLVKLPGWSGAQGSDQLRLAFSRTFKAPDLNSLTPRRRRIDINGPANPDVDGNPTLKPEIAVGIDVTYEHYFSKTALVSVGASHRRISDYTLTLVSFEPDGRWVGRPINAGRAEVRGLELEAKLPLTLLKAGWPAIDLRASLSRNWSSVAAVPGPDNRVAQQIPLQASLAADYASGAWTTGASFVMRQGAWSTVTARQRTLTVSRRDLDLYALWQRNPTQQIRITLGNLLAQGDRSASQFIGADGPTTRVTAMPGHASIRALFEQKF